MTFNFHPNMDTVRATCEHCGTRIGKTGTVWLHLATQDQWCRVTTATPAFIGTPPEDTWQV